MIELISSLDQLLFHLANGVWVSPALDLLMLALSVAGNSGAIWLVLLGTLAALGGKTGRKIASTGPAELAIDFAASEIVKELTRRHPRPFLSLPDARLLVSPLHSYAFPSGALLPAPSPRLQAPSSPRRGCWGGCRHGTERRWLWPPRSPTHASTSASTPRPALRGELHWALPVVTAEADRRTFRESAGGRTDRRRRKIHAKKPGN